MRKAGLALAASAWLVPAAAQQLPLEDRMKSCDPAIAIAAAKEVIADKDQVKEPLMLFSPSMVLYQHGARDEAVFWFYAAQLRTRYQLVFEQGDRGQLLMVMMMVAPGINNYAFQDVARFNRTLDKVLEWDRKTPNPYREREQTPEEREKVKAVYRGIDEMRKKLAAEKEEIEKQAREAAPHMQAMMDPKRGACAPGKPDPMYDRVTIEEDKVKVVEAAKVHPEVLKQAGTIQTTSWQSWLGRGGETLPYRHTVWVKGSNGEVWVEMNVIRSGRESRFELACTTPLSLSKRPALGDVCAATPATR